MRVKVADYGRLPRARTVPCESRRLHPAAAPLLSRMLDAVALALGERPRLASAWRAHRWRDRAHYETFLVQRYGSVAKGRRWLAFDSPHETGLAVDFGSMGLRPSSATADAQRRSPLYLWLLANAAGFGWHPYLAEPWHWECPLPRDVWAGVRDLSPGDGPPWKL